jgi:hypothetical protein
VKVELSGVLEQIALRMKDTREQRDVAIKDAHFALESLLRTVAGEGYAFSIAEQQERAFVYSVRAERYQAQLATLEQIHDAIHRQVAKEMQQ